MDGFELIHAAYDVPGLDEHERAVLVRLAVMARDGKAWPSIAHLVEKTGVSERTVQRAISRLVAAGHIERRQRRHDTAVYTIHPVADGSRPVRGTGVTVTPVSGTPVTDDVKTRRSDTLIAKNNQLPQKASPSSEKRARSKAQRMTEDWSPGPLPASVAKLVAGWPPGRLEIVTDEFRDFWITAERNAAKPDWNRAYHNRLRDRHLHFERFDHERPGSQSAGRAARGSGRPTVTDAVVSAFDRVSLEGQPIFQ